MKVKKEITHDKIAIGNRIREQRKKLGFTQERLVKEMRQIGDGNSGMSDVTLGRIENGEIGDFSIRQAIALSEILNCDVGYLLCEYNSQTITTEQIHDYIGLSEEAIETLHTLSNGEDELISQKMIIRLIITFLNQFLSDPEALKHLAGKLSIYAAIADMKRNLNGRTDERTDTFQIGINSELYCFFRDQIEKMFSEDIKPRKRIKQIKI